MDQVETQQDWVAEACALCARSLLDVLHHVASAVGRISGIVVVTASGSVDRARVLAKHSTLTQSQTGLNIKRFRVSVCSSVRRHFANNDVPVGVATSGSAVHAPRWASQVPADPHPENTKG